jgi:hypothetical protein
MATTKSIIHWLIDDIFQCGSTSQVVSEEDDIAEEKTTAAASGTGSTSTSVYKYNYESSANKYRVPSREELEEIARNSSSHVLYPRSSVGLRRALCACTSSSEDSVLNEEDDDDIRIPNSPATSHSTPLSQKGEKDESYHYVIRMSPEKPRHHPHKRYTYAGDHPELTLRRTQSDSLSQLPEGRTSPIITTHATAAE